MEQARFAIRHGKTTQYETAFRFIEHAITSGWIDNADAANVNLSSLARVLNDSYVRARLHGKPSEAEGLTLDLDDPVKAKLAKRLVADWSEGGKAVEVIYTQNDRVTYINGVAAELKIPQPEPAPSGTRASKQGSEGTSKTSGGAGGGGATRRSTRRKRHRHGPRKTIIPGRF